MVLAYKTQHIDRQTELSNIFGVIYVRLALSNFLAFTPGAIKTRTDSFYLGAHGRFQGSFGRMAFQTEGLQVFG